jgi:hypothetical protein
VRTTPLSSSDGIVLVTVKRSTERQQVWRKGFVDTSANVLITSSLLSCQKNSPVESNRPEWIVHKWGSYLEEDD